MMVRILAALVALLLPLTASAQEKVLRAVMHADEIGRASCRERV